MTVKTLAYGDMTDAERAAHNAEILARYQPVIDAGGEQVIRWREKYGLDDMEIAQWLAIT